MLRYRRYRVFVVFAVLTVLVLWQFAGSETWRSSGLGVNLSGGSSHGQAPAADNIPDVLVPPKSGSPIATEDKDKTPDVTVPAAEKPQEKEEPPALPKASKPVQGKPPPALETAASSLDDDLDSPYLDTDAVASKPQTPQIVVPHEGGEGRKEVDVEEKAIHWRKLEEHFPVSSTIQLPKGSPKPVPKIQATFAEESSAEKKERDAKLMAIKEAMTFSWNGYRKYAWMKDELSPVSNGSRNPFAGWGATLVDTLDTLYIMGMEDEFEEAVAAVADIDFTTTFRKDIPLFETVIRYLGGLIAAYDLSGLKHKILLDKAVELAEILMGSFDTPNRMPITFYYWMPTYASQPHRAGTRVVLAEIGSLSVEFTRLAQLTKEPKYYDAIARITNAFYEWQDTLLPGMWPVHVDASGCKRPEYKSAYPPLKPADKLLPSENSGKTPLSYDEEKSSSFTGAEKPKAQKTNKNNPERFGGKNPVPDDDHDDLDDELVKRQLDDPVSLSKAAALDESKEDEVRTEKATSSLEKAPTSTKKATATATLADCESQGLAASSPQGSQQFTLGGMSDSMYEYFPKEYLLLGGLAPEYQEMYEKSADVVKEELLFRPMLPDGSPDVLFSGTLNVNPPDRTTKKTTKKLKAEGTHLTCFAGGMFAYGAKIFGRTEDVKIGAQLTEGCVWAYNVTNTGIMPESFLMTACDSIKGGCEWNQTKYYEELDPYADSRKETYQRQLQYYSSQVASARAKATETAAESEYVIATAAATAEAVPTNSIPDSVSRHRWDRRQLGGVENDGSSSISRSNSNSIKGSTTPSKTTYSDAHEPADYDEDIKDPVIAHIWKPQKPLSHEEFVAKRIQEERLPEGFIRVDSKFYILRPEAIESVWYLYRITGDQHWREVGWDMFTAIQTFCRAEFGYSAIDDVTKTVPRLKDEMESFWLAETLKYFWLLFTDEDVVSLDEWVLNTEAHPFRRPDAGKWPKGA